MKDLANVLKMACQSYLIDISASGHCRSEVHGRCSNRPFHYLRERPKWQLHTQPPVVPDFTNAINKHEGKRIGVPRRVFFDETITENGFNKEMHWDRKERRARRHGLRRSVSVFPLFFAVLTFIYVWVPSSMSYDARVGIRTVEPS